MTRNNYPSSSSISRRTCATILSRVSHLPARRVAGPQGGCRQTGTRQFRDAAAAPTRGHSHGKDPEDAAYWDEYAWVKRLPVTRGKGCGTQLNPKTRPCWTMKNGCRLSTADIRRGAGDSPIVFLESRGKQRQPFLHRPAGSRLLD